MKTLSVLFVVLSLASAVAEEKPPTPAPTATPPVETDVSARSRALDLAGAFSNDGYKIRDGYWPGELEPSKPGFIEVNLFAGNEYWFSAAALSPARKIAVSVFDEKGKPVTGEVYEDGPVAAAGFVPEVSGRYFIKVALLEGEKSQFCLLYSYK